MVCQRNRLTNIGTRVWRVPIESKRATLTSETFERSISIKFSHLHDRVLVRSIEEEEKISGGLIIPETAKEKGGVRILSWSAKRAKSPLVKHPK